MRILFRLSCLVALTVVTALHAQQTPPIFRGGTSIVPLTVTVLDKAGKPVTDLKQDDFKILENDVPQELRNFFPQPMTPQPAPANTEAVVTRGAGADALTPAKRRTFLLVLGSGRIQTPGKAIDGAMKFVDRHLLPQDVVAVMAFNRASEFTTDHSQALEILFRYKIEHERIFARIREFRIRNPRLDLPESIQQDMDDIFGNHPIRRGTDLLLGMDGVKPLGEPIWNRPESLPELLERAARVPMRLSEQLISSPLLKVYAGIGYLRPLDGQKHLVWLGSALQRPSEDEDKRLAARANDARVILDIIHTTGAPPTSRWSWGPTSARNMTEWTGGYYTGVNYADVALASVDARSRFSYLLGYTPTNTTLDGKYREVKVQVSRRDVTVVFQHGYYATGEAAPVELRDLITSSRLSAAGLSDSVSNDITFEVKAAPIVVFGRTEMKIDLAINPKPLSFATTPNGRVATIDVHVFCGDADRKVLGESQRRFDVTVDEETHIRLLRDTLAFSMRVPAAGKVKYVKVVVYDFASDQLGTVLLTLR